MLEPRSKYTLLSTVIYLPQISAQLMTFQRPSELAADVLEGSHSVVEIFEFWTNHHRDHPAAIWVSDGEPARVRSYRDLRVQALHVSARLRERCRPGDRVILLFPPGIDFIAAFLGCFYAQVLPIPATEPKPRRLNDRLAAIAEDCRPAAVLCSAQIAGRIDVSVVCPSLVSLPWIRLEEGLPTSSDGENQRPEDCDFDRESLAFLQYTSGSTSEPKGVAITHRNLLQNLEIIRLGFRQSFNLQSDPRIRGVFWLPPYHDMGLIGGILTPLYIGGTTILMSPASFLKRPLRWLETISEYQASISGGPNFAFDLCADDAEAADSASSGLDLACWEVAFCGAEPIRAATLERFAQVFRSRGFRRDSFYPCYGLAEATLLVSGPADRRPPNIRRLRREALERHQAVHDAEASDKAVAEVVGCGRPILDGQIVIVDPETRQRCDDQMIGEIWYRGGSVADQGYWERPESNRATFQARLADGDADSYLRTGPYLRTGDLGFLSDGELFVTGRRKEMLVIRGRNFYPQDLERTVGAADPALSDAGAALLIEQDRDEKLVIVHELNREARGVATGELFPRICGALSELHGLRPSAILLVRPYSLPRTTSGKMQRMLCRQMVLDGLHKVVDQWVAPPPTESTANRPEATTIRPDVTIGEAAATDRESGTKIRSVRPTGGHDGELATFRRRRLEEELEEWIRERVAAAAGVQLDGVAPDRPLAELGLDSIAAVKLVGEIETRLSISLNPVILWNFPTARDLARHLGDMTLGDPPATPQELEVLSRPRRRTFYDLLEAVESMPDDDVGPWISETLRDDAVGDGPPHDANSLS